MAIAPLGNLIKRPAKLFETGEYLDKGMVVTEENLDAIVSNFNNDVELKVQHTDTIFDGAIGKVVSVWRKGKELFGDVELPQLIWSFLDSTNQKKLSVGISRDATKLVELSLVRKPRVASAQIFNDEYLYFSLQEDFADLNYWDKNSVLSKALRATLSEDDWAYVNDVRDDYFIASINGTYWRYDYTIEKDKANITKKCKSYATWRDAEDGESDIPPADNPDEDINDGYSEESNSNKENETMADTVSKAEFDALKANFEKERATNKKLLVNTVIGKLEAEGKIIPASKQFAETILSATEETVSFADGKISISEAFVKFMEAQPKIIELNETVENTGNKETSDFSGEVADIATKLGLTEDDVKKYGGK